MGRDLRAGRGGIGKSRILFEFGKSFESKHNEWELRYVSENPLTGDSIRELPEKIRNEWADNLVGAQYLDFPKNSNVDVDIRIKAVTAAPAGIQLKLVMRQFEHEVGGIEHPPFPILKQGEECNIHFSFANPEARKSFSFHLVGEGPNSSIQLQKFEVAVNRTD